MIAALAAGDTASLEALIRERLASLAPLRVDLIDDSARHAGHKGNTGGKHYRLQIVAACFSGHDRLARHRLVLDRLRELFGGQIHALSIRALTTDEYDDAAPAAADKNRSPFHNP